MQFWFAISCQAFLIEVWKKTLHFTQPPGAEHTVTIRNRFTHLLNQLLKLALPFFQLH